MHEATRRAEGRWAAPNGVESPFRPLSAATGVRPPQDTLARAARGATDAGKTPSARAGVLAREKKPRATRQAHCQRVSEADGRKTTLKSEFSEFAKEQCSSGVRRNVFGLWGFFLELIFGGVATHCSSRLPEFWWNFWRSVDMNFTKFGKFGPNLQRLNFEKFEKRRSGSRWFWVVGSKDYPGELV